MSLEFAIIPVTSDFISTAYDIQSKLKDNIKLSLTINIDTNYDTPLSTRINKWKKQEYDIITIDQDYNETNSIVVRFSDKGSRAQPMEVDEFIDLVASFEDEHKNNSNLDGSNNDNDNDVCIIM